LTLEAARQRVRKIVAAAKDGLDLPAKETEDRRRTRELAALIQHSGGRPGIWRAGAMST
jgi:hypothetical protein